MESQYTCNWSEPHPVETIISLSVYKIIYNIIIIAIIIIIITIIIIVLPAGAPPRYAQTLGRPHKGQRLHMVGTIGMKLSKLKIIIIIILNFTAMQHGR